MTHETLTAADVSDTELAMVEKLAVDLPQGSPLAVMLQKVVEAAQRGADVALLTSDRELTPNEAADLMNVSRGHLLKLMDEGVIAYRKVGTHRRLRMDDLMDYIERQERARAFVAHAVGTTAHSQRIVMDEAAEFTSDEMRELGIGG